MMGQARRVPRKIFKVFTGSSVQGYLVCIFIHCVTGTNNIQQKGFYINKIDKQLV